MLKRPLLSAGPRLGVDENGLGPRLGPLVVTGVLASVSESGARRLTRKLPKDLLCDLGDSKALLSHHNVSLGEAWARAVCNRGGDSVSTTTQLFNRFSIHGRSRLRRLCPPTTEAQCWDTRGEKLRAADELVARVSRHLDRLARMGIAVETAGIDISCAAELNAQKRAGVHRFAADLHAMERTILSLRKASAGPVVAVCGKVGGMTRYQPYFGPLAQRPHAVVQEAANASVYQFPDVGELRFVRAVDAADPLVMLASMIGKFFRELLMSRIARFYSSSVDERYSRPSGYHDFLTKSFIAQTEPTRRHLRVANDCFERQGAKS